MRAVAIGTLLLSVLAMFKPELRLWAVHQLAFLPIALSCMLLLFAALLLSPFGVKIVSLNLLNRVKLPPVGWAAVSFALFMLLSVYGNLLGDGQLAIARLAHLGEMLETGQNIPPGRLFSQKEPGTMLLHEGVFRVAMQVAGPDIQTAPGKSVQDARVERQFAYREIAAWCYRILSSLAGMLLVLLLIQFVRAHGDVDPSVFWLMLLTSGAWLMFFGYVENYAWVSLAMVAFLIAGLKSIESPGKIPFVPIVVFGIAVAMHYLAVVLFPALVYVLWTMHFEQRESAAQNLSAQSKRLKLLIAILGAIGLAGYVYVKGWNGWISVLPLLPQWVSDGYAMLSIKHAVDLFNLMMWAVIAGAFALFFSKRLSGSIKRNNQENFLSIAAGASALFAVVFSPNLGMARDWDIVSAALWPAVFYAAWRTSQLEFDSDSSAKLRASLLSLVILILVPAVLVQSQQHTAIARYRNLLVLDHSRSAYGWENLALYYQRTGELDKRIDAWEHAVAAERNPRYLFNLADAYKLADRMDAADTTAIAAAKVNKEYAGNLFFFAVAQARRNKLDRARVLVNTALELDSTLAYGESMKWWAEKAFEVDSIAKTGDLETARKLLSYYAQVDSTNSYWRDYEMRLGE